MNTEARFPSIHASAAFTDSAVVHANHVGVNPIELDALSQVISRLSRDESTVAPSSMERELRELEELGYIEISTTQAGTLVVTTRAPGQLLSAYFWSVWIPRHLFSCSLKVSLVPHLCCGTQDSQHLTAVFRIAGSKDAAREFLHQLANNYPGHEPGLPELVAVQVGDALSKEAESSRRPRPISASSSSMAPVSGPIPFRSSVQPAPGATRWQPPALPNDCLARTTHTSPVCRYRQATTKSASRAAGRCPVEIPRR